MTQKIVQHCVKYGTGQDTLRCLALGTVDEPPTPNAYNLFILRDVFLLIFILNSLIGFLATG